MSKYLLTLSTSIGALAGVWTWLAFTMPNLGPVPFVLWPTFISWAAFFFVGATVDGMVKGLVQLFTGTVLSWMVMMIFVASNVPAASVPLVLGIFVAIIAWVLTAISGLHKLWSLAPAGFCGAACYFGVVSAVPAAQAHSVTHVLATLFPLAAGELLGLLCVTLAAPAKAPAAEVVRA